MAAQLSLILITPDTSPRGEQVAQVIIGILVKVQAFILMPLNNLGLSIIKWSLFVDEFMHMF
jgi:hypothetical protein